MEPMPRDLAQSLAQPLNLTARQEDAGQKTACTEQRWQEPAPGKQEDQAEGEGEGGLRVAAGGRGYK